MSNKFYAILIKLFPAFLSIFFNLLTIQSSKGQEKYWVFFSDKQGVSFNPYKYFDIKAIERRNSLNIPLYDITDFPVNESYLNKVKEKSDSIAYESRWFNAVAVYAGEAQIKEILNFTFVDSVQKICSSALAAEIRFNNLDSNSLQILKRQTERMGGEFFRKNNFDGKGIRIAVFDAGFPNVDKSPAFEHIRRDNRIIKTWNFPAKKEYVYESNHHGTMVMSCICGKYNDIDIGLATGAEFLLARTEIKRETFPEEENWLAAAEWADKNGADIINSSLGYTNQRYFPEQMDGKYSLATRAAEMAARKGILVVNAAGNEGTNAWKKIIAPADADSIISVGGIDPDTDYHIPFSSYGPTADKRMKPNVCAFGTVIAAGPNRYQKVQGTSFASPLVAGFAACAWQSKRALTNMQMKSEIEKSADLYPYFDYAHGFGVPQAEYFTNGTKISDIDNPTFDFVAANDTLKIVIKDKYLDSNSKNNPLLFYNIQDSKGVLEKYYVISVYNKDVLEFKMKKFVHGEKINVRYGKYYSSYAF